MNRFAFSSLILLAACRVLNANAGEQDNLPIPQPISAVWTATQVCMGLTAESLQPSSDAGKIKNEGAIEFKQFGIRYKIPYVPKVDKFVLKVVLGDTSRRVIDNYILISDQDLKAPFGAVVVTVLPPAITNVDGAFAAVDTLQRGLAQSSYQLIHRREFDDSRLGRGVEYITPNRVGTLCFPTSKYQFVTPEMGIKTTGISRFFVRGNELVEVSYIVNIPESIPAADQQDFVRREMDRYLAGLSLTEPAH
ncbi:hypothetical protein H3H37_15985 [Duganella sp. LX20W]|uniref:Uncharacterized protein n=1 Tax=Rugamonas brunnea TaxID=2758569 RepID=A0A7W2EU20_9BURK|nr:hypothetical protein [Rugamonas brunnea]MBA5638560.1 hypothetical protein [Rugamonas brunnea]